MFLFLASSTPVCLFFRISLQFIFMMNRQYGLGGNPQNANQEVNAPSVSVL
jgi:hypothetical protein